MSIIVLAGGCAGSLAGGSPPILAAKGLDMRVSTTAAPGALDKPLDAFLSTHMPPSSSRVPPIYRETTVCYAYMCPYAYGCSEKTNRPAQVLMRRCMRYIPDSLRIKPGLSDFSLDLLARRRKAGEKLNAATNAILDELRPDGPLRKTA